MQPPAPPTASGITHSPLTAEGKTEVGHPVKPIGISEHSDLSEPLCVTHSE